MLIITCLTLAPTPPSFSCTFSPGDGSGGSEVKVGSQTGSQCVDECIKHKLKDNSINGVTIYSNRRAGCWCEKNMKSITKNAKYKTCILKPMTLGIEKLMFLLREVL